MGAPAGVRRMMRYGAPLVLTFSISFDPVLAHAGNFELGWHGLFTALATVVAVALGIRLAAHKGMREDAVASAATWGIVGGIIGARLFHVLDHLDYYLANPAEIPAIWEGGIAVYGAFVGGIVGGWIAARAEGLPTWPLLDAAASAMLVGQAIGRLGCLSNGDAWGAPCGTSGLGICVTYTNPNDLIPAPLLGVPTHAYPIYEIAAEVALLALLWVLRRQLAALPGQTFLVAAIGYALIRFGLTFFRQETIILWGLQEAQVIALITGALALVLLCVLSFRPQMLGVQPQPRPFEGAT